MFKRIKISITIGLMLMLVTNSIAQFSREQQDQIAELKAIIDDKNSNDTTKAAAYTNLSEFFGVSNRDSMYILSVEAQKIAENTLQKNPDKATSKSLKISLSSALNNIGYYYKSVGNSVLALEYYQKSISILEDIDYKIGLGSSYNNIGLLHYTLGNIPFAIEFFHKSLKIREKINDKKGIAAVFNNLGSLYKNQDNIPQAIDYYTKCLNISEEIGDKKGLAYSYNNMGILYFIKKEYDLTIDFHQKSLKIKEEIGDKRGISESYHNIAKVYQSLTPKTSKEADSLTNLAMNFFLKSLNLKEEINDKIGIATTLSSIGHLELSQGLVNNAKTKGLRALSIAKEVGFVIEIQRAAALLYDVAMQQQNWKEALDMRNLELQMKDSITSEKALKIAINQQAKYEYEKQKALDDAEHEKQLAIEQEAKAKQKIISYAIAGGLVLVILFFGFVFNRLQVTKKQKNIIEAQKQEVEQQKEIVEKAHLLLEEKNSEIIASIRYAKRIQDALLTSQKYIERNINRLKNQTK
ncbi:MAG: tetratricopeptide repeat protein [Flavobacteriales bacterium]|nr:tetratricopeptide repeat protein [Flavobacteriales bacterium]